MWKLLAATAGVVTLIGGAVLQPTSALQYGQSPVGFRTERLDPREGLPPGRIHLWYPAQAGCETPLTYGDYLRGDAQYPNHDVGAELRQAWAVEPGLDDARWARVTATPMRACRDAAPATARVPVIVALALPGAWPVAAEYFTSHGLAFAAVHQPLASAPAGELIDRMTRRKQGFVDDLERALHQLRRMPYLDVTRVGALGQNHALLMLAMRRPDVRAVALQDSSFQEGVEAESNRRTGYWEPARHRAALLHAIPRARVPDESAWEAFASAAPGAWARLIITPPHHGHNDVTADGYLTRVRAPIVTPPHGDLITVFEGLLRAQRAFFDQHLAPDRQSAPLASVIDRALFTLEVR